jgi:hypothetical protein
VNGRGEGRGRGGERRGGEMGEGREAGRESVGVVCTNISIQVSTWHVVMDSERKFGNYR